MYKFVFRATKKKKKEFFSFFELGKFLFPKYKDIFRGFAS